jgi:type I restriction enzyme S subunit
MSNLVSGWEEKQLRSICEIHYGKSPSEVRVEFSNFEIWGTGGRSGYSSTSLFDGPFTLVGRKGTISKPLWIEKDSWVIDTAYAVKAKKSIDEKFLYYLLDISDLKELNESTGVPSLNRETLYNLKVNYPTLEDEQKKISEILTSVDKVIELTEIEIEKLKNLKKGVMQDLLTKGIGHTKFKDSPIGKIPENWEVKTLDELKLDKNGIVDGPFGSNLKTIHYRTEGIPIMQSGFVTSNRFFAKKYLYVDQEKFDEQKRSSIQGGDILMAKIGAKCGTCAIVPSNHPVSILAGNSMKLTFNQKKISNEYVLLNLHLWGELGSLDRLKTETAQPALSITSLKKAKIAVPSINEQVKIVKSIDSIDKSIVLKKKKFEQVNKLKKGLMQDLLTGKVRVKV